MIFVVYALTIIAAALQMQHYLPMLPEKMATHFDMQGHPNGWMTRDRFVQFYLWFFLATTGGCMIFAQCLPRLPAWMINLRHKNYWLSTERRAETFATLIHLTRTTAVAVAVLIVAMMQLVIQTNLREDVVLDNRAFYIMLGIFAVYVIGMAIYSTAKFRKPDETA